MTKEIDYIGNLKKMMLYRFSERGRHGDVIMLRPISEEDEKYIDENNTFNLKRDDGTVTLITKTQILFYGEIDLNNKDDRKIIARRKLVDENLRYSQIPEKFNYNTGLGLRSQYATNSAIKWFEFVHCRLGKPKRVICYKIKEDIA